jgi:hypothetical protein
VFPSPDVFWPVTGMRTRPDYLFVSPTFAPARAQPDSARR